ncbi:MAG: hypothetical protein LBR58_07000 [Propionibacteriaceae bacterium]|jgi:FtsH-binding integral membrane protein|nr:hypothetical protein [Propionibacteriaceae bacterium]
MATSKPTKKVVKAEKSAAAAGKAPEYVPSAEAKSQATTKRIIAAVLWVLAIGLEAFAIFWVLKQFGPAGTPIFGMSGGTGALILLIILLVVIGVLAVIGSMQWKAANRLDPAKRADGVRFFIQNQLGAIVTVVAFLPLIILILLNKDMDTKQKGIAGAVGGVVLVVAVLLGWDWNPVAAEDYSYDDQVVAALAGQADASGVDVYWVDGGSVYHVCAEVPDLNRASKACEDPESEKCVIRQGTVSDAIAANKTRLTSKWESEAAQYCGIAEDRIAAAKAVQVEGAAPAPDTGETTEPEPEPSPTES